MELQKRKELVSKLITPGSRTNAIKAIESYLEEFPDSTWKIVLEDAAKKDLHFIGRVGQILQDTLDYTLRDIVENSYDNRTIFEYHDGETYQYAGVDKEGNRLFTKLGKHLELFELDLNQKVKRLF